MESKWICEKISKRIHWKLKRMNELRMNILAQPIRWTFSIDM